MCDLGLDLGSTKEITGEYKIWINVCIEGNIMSILISPVFMFYSGNVGGIFLL